MRIHVIRHVPFVYYGHLETWLKLWNVDVVETRFFQGQTRDSLIDADLLLVLGGPMSAYDLGNHPWIQVEMEYIEKAIQKKQKVLGICLGAQMIAQILGAKSYPAQNPEIGWHPIRPTAAALKNPYFFDSPKELVTFQWHADAFEIPAGCENLFSSEAHENQGFSCGEQIVGLQFHPEMDEKGAMNLLWRLGSELDHTQPYVQSLPQIKEGFVHACKNYAFLTRLIDRMIDA